MNSGFHSTGFAVCPKVLILGWTIWGIDAITKEELARRTAENLEWETELTVKLDDYPHDIDEALFLVDRLIWWQMAHASIGEVDGDSLHVRAIALD